MPVVNTPDKVPCNKAVIQTDTEQFWLYFFIDQANDIFDTKLL